MVLIVWVPEPARAGALAMCVAAAAAAQAQGKGLRGGRQAVILWGGEGREAAGAELGGAGAEYQGDSIVRQRVGNTW